MLVDFTGAGVEEREMSIASEARCYNTECPIMFVQVDGTLCHDFDKCVRFKPSEKMREANEEIARRKESDPVQHPSHYQGKYECIDLMRAMFGDKAVFDFCKCNSFKYRFRAGKKDGSSMEEDIAKAEFYKDYMMELYNEAILIDE